MNGWRTLLAPLAILVFLLGLAGLAFAGPPTCDICGRRVSGQAWQYDAPGQRLTVCDTCQRTLPRCSLCGVPTRRKAGAGEPLCARCAPQALACSYCGHLLTKTYAEYKLGDKTLRVCDSCKASMAECSVCRLPTPSSQLWRAPDGSLWCRHCYSGTKVCSMCGNPVRGEYMTMQFREGAWCQSCWSSHPHCDICQCPIGKGGKDLFDGRHICGKCASTMVSGTDAFRAMMPTINEQLTKLLGSPLRDQPPLLAATQQTLAEATKTRTWFFPGSDKAAAEDTKLECGVFRVDGRKTSIWILDSLPEDLAWETVAHEMAHAWQHEHYPQCTDPLLVEGFAQWFAEYCCYNTGKRSGIELLRKRTDLYGVAFRLVNSIETRDGVPGVLKALSINTVPGHVKVAN